MDNLTLNLTAEQIDAVNEYCNLNRTHDFTYMFSDYHKSYNAGLAQAEELEELRKSMNEDQIYLIGLHHNHYLKRNDEQFKFNQMIEGRIYSDDICNHFFDPHHQLRPETVGGDND